MKGRKHSFIGFLLIASLVLSCTQRDPMKAFNNTGVTHLDLSNRNLDSIPREAGNLANVVSLDLSNNHIKSIPPCLCQLKTLRVLNLGWNEIEDLPAAISELSSLEELTLSANRLTDLPAALARLPKLRVLKVSWNQLESLPSELGTNRTLETLELYDNPFRDEDSIRALFHQINLNFNYILRADAPIYYFNKAAMAHQSNNLVQALRYYDMTLTLDPAQVFAYRNRGLIRFNANDKGGGCSDWQTAASLGDTVSQTLVNTYCR